MRVEGVANDDEYESLEIFDNDNDAYEAYNLYALNKGFSIRTDRMKEIEDSK